MLANAVALTQAVDAARDAASEDLDADRRGDMGQFMTPRMVAAFMAKLFRPSSGDVRLLDPGAGVGSLTAAFVEEVLNRKHSPKSINAVLFEIEPQLVARLDKTAQLCRDACASEGVRFEVEVRHEDFIRTATAMLRHDLFSTPTPPRFTHVIMNPPYRKIRSDSAAKHELQLAGIDSTNLYAAFLALSVRLLEPDGELVAITPRSFCNGPYFRAFRKDFFADMTLTRVHVFESRGLAFSGDGVLQENVIFHAVKNPKRKKVVLSVSNGPGEPESSRVIDHADVVWPSDPEQFVHLALTDDDDTITKDMQAMPCALEDLGIAVSTGRVVDFRARDALRQKPSSKTIPLIYACHFDNGFVTWPGTQTRKPNALLDAAETQFLQVPSGTYTLTKRFTSKEERRRVVAAVYDPARVGASPVGFENHLNYFHRNGEGLDPTIAQGLACYLNSTFVDRFFRLFSGHTQVNATDLRLLRYPSLAQLRRLAKQVGDNIADQERVDSVVSQQLLGYRAEGKASAKKCLDASS